MMKILLCIAPWRHPEIYTQGMTSKGLFANKFGKIPGATPPLGLLYVATSLKKAGHKVEIIDGILSSEEEILECLRTQSFDLIGFYINDFLWPRTNKLISKIKSNFPKIITVIGGTNTHTHQEKYLVECEDLDFVITGEGEIASVQLCGGISKKKDLNNIEGLIWRRNGKIIKNKGPAIIDDLDKLPFPDLELINLNNYIPNIGFYRKLPSMNFICSRGCKYNCIFCKSDKNLRFRSVKNIVEHIKSDISKFWIKEYIFYDENITMDRGYCMKLCNEIIKQKIKVSWCANARVDTIDEELLKLMKKAGCWRLLYGIESGVQKNLDFLNKNITLKQIRKAISITKKIGIETFGAFIFGIPGETYKDGLKTIKFAYSLGLDYANFGSLTPFPGTKLWKIKEKYGMHYPGVWSSQQIPFVPFSMTKEELAKLKVLAFRGFYLRPSYILKRALKIKSIEDLKRNLRGFFAYSSFKKDEFC